MQSYKYILKLVYFCLLIVDVNLLKQKRNIIYPQPNSKVQLIMGAGFPVATEDPSITIGYTLKCDYRVPKNISDYSEPEVLSVRRNKDIRFRWELYTLLAQLLEKFGGKVCIFKAICELASNPLDKRYGMLEEIIHLIFTPSVTRKNIGDSIDKEYLAAEQIGKKRTSSCSFFFPECALNLIDLFTKWM